MKKTVITYGLLAGFILVFLTYITRPLFITPDGKMDMGKGEVLGYINMLLSMSMIFFGTRQYRDKHLEGKITFRKAFWAGFLIAVIASVIYTIGWMIYYNTSEVAHSFPQQYLEYMKTKWAESGKSAEEMAKMTEQMAKNMELYKNPIAMTLMTLLEILPLGAILAVISAFILRRK